MEKSLTKEEMQAISALQKLAKKWPKSLWLFSGSGSLNVMRSGKDGKPVYKNTGGVDPDYSIDIIDIPNDGGDW